MPMEVWTKLVKSPDSQSGVLRNHTPPPLPIETLNLDNNRVPMSRIEALSVVHTIIRDQDDFIGTVGQLAESLA